MEKYLKEPGFETLRLDELPEPVIITDAVHRIVSINEAAAKLLEYTRLEVVGWPLEKVFPRRPAGIDLLVGRGAGAAEMEVRARLKSGKMIPASFLASPIKRDGEVTGVIYLGRDIRVHRLIDQEMKRSREYFRIALAAAPIGLAVTDLSRRIVLLNGAAEQLTGFMNEECAGGPVSAYLSEDQDLTEEELKRLSAGERISHEVELVRKDGVTIPVLVSAAYVEAVQGEGPYVVEAYIDQTDRKRLDNLKNEFVFIAAHELRSPVTAINLLLNLIFEDKRVTLDPILRDYLTKLHEAEERLLQLVDDLLEVSRTEVGRLKIKVAPQDIGQHIMAVFGDFRANALSRGVALTYDPGVHQPLVMADTTKLREVLINLISNAVKYNVPGGTVTVEHQVRGGMLATTVRDTGIGISKEDQTKLFRKFWRSEDFAVRSQPGTGLGLFIIKEVIERMGGTVEIDSERGRGTSFTFTLPLAPPEAKVI